MRKIFSLTLIAVVAAISFISCEDDIFERCEYEVEGSDVLYVDQSGGEVSFRFECDQKWTLALDSDWLQFVDNTYSSGRADVEKSVRLKVSPAAEVEGDSRSAKVYLNCRSYKREQVVTVVQLLNGK